MLRVQTYFDDATDASESVSDVELSNHDPSVELESKDRPVRSASYYTLDEEAEIVKAFDRRLVPFLALLYLLSFLDRSSMSSTFASRSSLP